MRAVEALRAAGLDPSEPTMIDSRVYEIDRWGGADDEIVVISTLGPYASGQVDDMPARRALEAAGFQWIQRSGFAEWPVAGLGVPRRPAELYCLLFGDSR